MNQSRTCPRVVLALVASPLIAGCATTAAFLAGLAGGLTTPSGANRYVLKPEVRLMDKLAPQASATLSANGITYSGLPSNVSIQPGDVLLSTMDEGYLRKVVSVQRIESGGVEVETEVASLEEVFQEGTFSVSTPLLFEAQQPTAKTRRIKLDSSIGLHPVLQVGPQITLDTGLEYHCDVSYSLGRLKSVRCYVTGTLTADALLALSVGGGVHAMAEKELIPTTVVGAFTLGLIPVTVNLDLSLGGEFDFEVAGSLGVGTILNAEIEAGVGYDVEAGRLYPVARHGVSFTPHEVAWNIGATPSLEVHLGTKLSVKAVGIVGPFVELKAPSLNIEYGDGVVSAAPGIAAAVGGELKIFSLRLAGISIDVFDVRWNPWTWTVRPRLAASAGADKTITSAGASVVLDGSATGGDGNYAFRWSPPGGLDNPNFATPRASPVATTTYTLTVTDGTGATDTDDVVVAVGPTVGDAPFVGGSGNFTRTNGSFEIAMSPRDSQGNFIGTELPQSAYSFQNVVLDPDAAGSNIAVATTITSVDVTQPGQERAITAVIIFDSSGSMASNDPGAMGRRAGGNAFFDLLTVDDEVAVLDFGPTPTGGLGRSRLLQDFTSNNSQLRAALDLLTQVDGTPLYGSILDGLDMLSARLGGTGGVVIVLTDGEADDGSLFSTVVGRAQSQQVPIYPIGLGNQIDFGQLANLAQQTRGTFAEAGNAAAMQTAFEGIGAGVTVGKVTVHASCTYAQANPGRYAVRGSLVTASGVGSIVTPFNFTVNIP